VKKSLSEKAPEGKERRNMENREKLKCEATEAQDDPTEL
jgi:hypothetical protein